MIFLNMKNITHLEKTISTAKSFGVKDVTFSNTKFVEEEFNSIFANLFETEPDKLSLICMNDTTIKSNFISEKLITVSTK